MAGLYELWPDPEKEKDDPERWLWTVPAKPGAVQGT
jgi:hypothetical protein